MCANSSILAIQQSFHYLGDYKGIQLHVFPFRVKPSEQGTIPQFGLFPHLQVEPLHKHPYRDITPN